MSGPDIEAAGAVVYSPAKDAFLLLKHRQGHWAFAQGKLEGKEDLREAAKREVEEETGLDIDDFDDSVEVRVTYHYRHRRRNIRKDVTFFLVVSDEDVTISDEHHGFIWVDFATAHKLLRFRNHTKSLEAAGKRLQERGFPVKGFFEKKSK